MLRRHPFRQVLAALAPLLLAGAMAGAAAQEPPEFPPGKGKPPKSFDKPPKGGLGGLQAVAPGDWDEAHVRRVLQAFALGGRADDTQIAAWARMPPSVAIRQLLTFDPVNLRLSPADPDDPTLARCGSLLALQEFWSSDDPANPMRVVNRPFYAVLDDERPAVDPLALYLVWTRAMHTPGCNPFVHFVAFYLTNYHAAIHVQNTGPVLMRAYYDDTLDALARGEDFVGLMHNPASHAALSLAYGHAANHFDAEREFNGNDDFAREYFQLLFGIDGRDEDPDYHEDVTIEHNAWLLTGMNLDVTPYAFGSEQRIDWFSAPIVFSNHRDAAGRLVLNQAAHYAWELGAGSCLEILRQPVCGATADDKLRALGPVAAAHPESMDSTPLKLARFFGDTRLDAAEMDALRSAWAEAGFDVLEFLRAYAISTAFHDPSTFRFRSAFERNLAIHNLNQLTSEEAYSELFIEGPILRMFEQGALVFAPIRDVFGGQTGADVANDRFVFKQAWDANVEEPEFLAKASEPYQLVEGQVVQWRKDWGAVIPTGAGGAHRVDQVADWLWRRFVGDDGRYYDAVARAQLHALLATGADFGYVVDPANPDAVYRSTDFESGTARAWSDALGAEMLDLSGEQGNHRVGMAINFITALPYTFAVEGGP